MAGTIQPWSPLREMERFRRNFDELFDRLFSSGGASPELRSAFSAPAIESFVEGEQLIVRADLPGIEPDKVEVSVTGNTLTIRGSREAKHEEKGTDFIHREISYGSFDRSLTLPAGVKTEQIKASYRNGVLELQMPVPKELATRKVAVEIEAGGGGAGAKKIEATHGKGANK